MEHSWGGEQISKWTPMSSRNSPSLHHQQSLSHGLGKFDWSSIELFFCTLSFQQDALTSCLIIKHYCLPSHISGLWWLMILPPDLGKSQVVSMCLKLATPRTSGGLNKTPCIKVRKMKRRRLHRTYRTFNDTVRRYHQCQWNIYNAKRAQNWCQNFSLTQSPQTSFLSLQMLMQRRNRTKTTKARNHFFVFFIFFQTISPRHMSPSASTGPCPKQLYVIDCDTGTCSTSSFRH